MIEFKSFVLSTFDVISFYEHNYWFIGRSDFLLNEKIQSFYQQRRTYLLPNHFILTNIHPELIRNYKLTSDISIVLKTIDIITFRVGLIILFENNFRNFCVHKENSYIILNKSASSLNYNVIVNCTL